MKRIKTSFLTMSEQPSETPISIAQLLAEAAQIEAEPEVAPAVEFEPERALTVAELIGETEPAPEAQAETWCWDQHAFDAGEQPGADHEEREISVDQLVASTKAERVQAERAQAEPSEEDTRARLARRMQREELAHFQAEEGAKRKQQAWDQYRAEVAKLDSLEQERRALPAKVLAAQAEISEAERTLDQAAEAALSSEHPVEPDFGTHARLDSAKRLLLAITRKTETLDRQIARARAALNEAYVHAQQVDRDENCQEALRMVEPVRAMIADLFARNLGGELGPGVFFSTGRPSEMGGNGSGVAQLKIQIPIAHLLGIEA